MAKLLKSLLVFFLLVAAYAKKSSIHTKDVQNEDAYKKDITSTYIVTMLKGTRQVLRSFSTKKITTFSERVGTLAQTLQSHAKVSQEPVHKYLKTIKDPNLEIRPLWAQNKIILKNPPAKVILHLQTHFANLLHVEPDFSIPFDDPPPSSTQSFRASEKNESWGIQRIQAEEAVKLLQSSKSGPLPQIRVATIDSGALLSHEALRDNYLGEYGWHNPIRTTTEPDDWGGHGSHVMGIIAGSQGIGVFPQATWMACKGCQYGGCASSHLLECAQWVLCPYLPTGEKKENCSMAPHIVSNSWGSKLDTYFDSSVEAWQAAGIIVVKSAGNNGRKGCSSLTYFADLEGIISVAATMANDTLVDYSSRGPTSDGRVSPDFAAPGYAIVSVDGNKEDDAYIYKSGTSMACPHVTGIVALLMAYDESLGYDGIVEALKAGVETKTLTVPDEDLECGGIPYDVFPNNNFGHGLVNALSSLTYLIEKSSSKPAKGTKAVHKKGVHTKDVNTEKVSSSTYIMTMLKGTQNVLHSFSNKKITTFAKRVGTLAQELQSHAKVSQEPVHKYLKTIKDPNLQITPLWAQNALILRNAPADVIRHLKTHFSHLLRVDPDFSFPLDDPPPSSSKVLHGGKFEFWGIKRIQAEEAVSLLKSSVSGPLPQIRVAAIDSGARVSHEALRDNFLGEYGFFDPQTLSSEPDDSGGHGSHVVGTIVGSKGIGVFPQAKWMACKGCRDGLCVASDVVACAQWVLCPTLTDNTSPNCSLAPHVVSNSWGFKSTEFFDSSVEAWRAAGIVVVKSAGNKGYLADPCGSLTYPAGLEGVISVAATTRNDTLRSDSSKGPTSDGRVSPEFAAPGGDIASVSHVGDDAYIYKSGTSMACPHVSGIVALLLAYDENLGYDGIMEALKAGVETSTLTVPGQDKMCGGIPSDVFPNNAFGHGLVNALASLTYLIEKSSLGHTKNAHTKDVHTKDVSSTYIVTMLKGTQNVLRSFSTKKITTFAKRVGTLAQELQSHAKVSQEPVHKYLKTIKDPNLEVRSLWAQNALILKNAPADVIRHLKTHFSHLVRVEPDFSFPLDDPLPSSSKVLRKMHPEPLPLPPADWGIKRIQAEEAVTLLLSSKSAPLPQIRVAAIDTGVRVTHEALRDNFLGEYGFFDPQTLSAEPVAMGGHGSHVTGIIAGSKGIGVFPQATWMACVGCRHGSCIASEVLGCAQWVLCPTLSDWGSPNCSLAPHIVSNSWGFPSGSQLDFFDSSVEAQRAVGMIVVFAVGNNFFTPKVCASVKYPALLEEVITVGMTKSNDSLSASSAYGPTADGRVKPDFSAPGFDISSASHKADDEYVYMAGTSMACPHVSGLIAILLAYDENLGYDGIMEALKAGVETSTLTVPGEDKMCGGIPFDVFPNNAFGHGRINALRSLNYLIKKSKQQQIKIDLKSV